MLYFAYCDHKGKWQVSDSIQPTPVKLDVVQISLPEPHWYDK